MRRVALIFFGLALVDVPVSIVILVSAGLGHSVRANAQAPLECVLSFLVIAVLPTLVVLLWGKSKRLVWAAALTYTLCVALVLGRLGLWPPLMYAVNHNHVATARLLLRMGSSQRIYDRYDGWTPLTSSVVHGYGEMTGLLLEHGADPNERDRDGRPPLCMAYFTRNEGIFASLLARGADPMTPVVPGRPLLVHTLLEFDMRYTRLLARSVPPESRSYGYAQDVLRAMERHDTAALEQLKFETPER